MNFFIKALYWEYYSMPKNLVVIQFIIPYFEFKSWEKHEKCQNLEGFLQILTGDNYEQTNGIQLEFFLKKPYAGNTTADWRIK